MSAPKKLDVLSPDFMADYLVKQMNAQPSTEAGEAAAFTSLKIMVATELQGRVDRAVELYKRRTTK